MTNTTEITQQLEEHARSKNIAAQMEQDVALVAKLGLVPFKDGDHWCYLYGKDLVDGISGFGETISKAAANFTHKFYNEKA